MRIRGKENPRTEVGYRNRWRRCGGGIERETSTEIEALPCERVVGRKIEVADFRCGQIVEHSKSATNDRTPARIARQTVRDPHSRCHVPICRPENRRTRRRQSKLRQAV